MAILEKTLTTGRWLSVDDHAFLSAGCGKEVFLFLLPLPKKREATNQTTTAMIRDTADGSFIVVFGSPDGGTDCARMKNHAEIMSDVIRLRRGHFHIMLSAATALLLLLTIS